MPANEQDRLARLHELFVLDSPAEPAFDSIAAMAARICGTPVALISLVDGQRQWFKANIGLAGVSETPRDVAFCAHTILSDRMLVVPDALRDARFADNPIVIGEPAIRFYAGAPLVLPGGERIGTLCVIDFEPRYLDDHQTEMLGALARMAIQTLSMRRDLITQSLSAKTKHEQMLAASVDEMADLYDNAPCGYYSLDAQGKFLRINNTALEWLGCSREEVIGRMSSADFLTAEGKETFRRNFPALMQCGKVDGMAFDLVSRSGEVRHIAASASAIYDADGVFVASRTVTHDITAQKQAEASRRQTLALEAENRQLAEISRVKGVFLSNMSHELRTPLNAVLGYTHLLQAGALPPDSPKFKRYLDQIGASGRHLLGLIDTVLTYAQADSETLALRPEAVALKPLLQGALETLHDESLQKGSYITLEVEAALGEVVTDELALTRVVSHYLSNAIKFSEAGATVTVRAWAVGSTAFRIEVEDSGSGIAEADIARLFQPFQQLSEGRTKTHCGTGLGLALVRRLVEAQGGSVGVQSRVGIGSLFWAVLPQAATVANTAAPHTGTRLTPAITCPDQ